MSYFMSQKDGVIIYEIKKQNSGISETKNKDSDLQNSEKDMISDQIKLEIFNESLTKLLSFQV